MPTAPAPAILNKPGAIHVAAGDPAGLHSLTWTIQGAKNRDDVFISSRQTRGNIKLSLHEADAQQDLDPSWNLAWTSEYAAAQNMATDRRIYRWNEAREVAQGWRHAAVILVPTIAFGTHTERPLRGGQTVQWWEAPPAPEQLCFHVYVGDPSRCDLTITDHIGDVGRMTLAGGRCVWVIADSRPANPTVLNIVTDTVQLVRNTPGALPFTWHDDGGIPRFLDLAATLGSTA
jgi:hypothetical protein